MSLIALTLNNVHEGHPAIPLMLADILISSNFEDENVSLPTFLDGAAAHLPNDAEYKPIELNQKLYVINDFVAVALAGDVFEMKQVLAAIKDFMKYEEMRNESLGKKYFSTEVIKDMLENYLQPLQTKNCSFCIAFVNNPNSFNTEFYGKWIQGKCNAFGFFAVTGSGAPGFIENGLFVSPKSEMQDQIPWVVLDSHMNLLGRFLAAERMNLETLKDHWGAGYELVMFEKGKFKKLDNTTFLFLGSMINEETGKEKFSVLYVHNSIYYDDLLLINAINIVETKGQGYIVPALDTTAIYIDSLPPVLQINSNHVCIIYIPEFSRERMRVDTFFITGRLKDSTLPPFVKVTNDDVNGFNVIIDENVQTQIWDIINARNSRDADDLK